jgi:hypothetical protein
VVFIPPDAQLSVEDSIGRSTFEVLSFSDLGVKVAAEALGRLKAANPELAEAAERAVELIGRYDQLEHSGMATARFYIAVMSSDGPESVGRALTHLGLLPDRELALHASEDLQRRIQLNAQQMAVLTDTSDPADRLRRLPIGDKGQRELVDVLKQVIQDGETDRIEICRRLDEVADIVDYGHWNLNSLTVTPEQFSIVSVLGLEGELKDTIVRTESSVGVRFFCKPAPANVLNARNLLLEIVELGRTSEDLIETGFAFTKSALPKSSSSQWRKKIDLADPSMGLDAGLYRFRLSLISFDNTTIAETLSDEFRVGEELISVSRLQDHVLGIGDAQVKAIASGLTARDASSPTLLSAVDEKDAALDVAITFEGVGGTWIWSTPLRLAEYEHQLLSDPSVRGFQIELTELGTEEVWLDSATDSLSADFIEAREELFDAIGRFQRVDGELFSVLRADLRDARDYVERYVRCWIQSLGTADAKTRSALLSTDRVQFAEKGRVVAVLLAPTHPLLLAWLSLADDSFARWLSQISTLEPEDVKREAEELAGAIDDLVPRMLPPVVLNGATPYRSTDSFGRGWNLYVSPSSGDPRRIVASIRSWLRLPAWRLGTYGEAELLSRVRGYLTSHPYVRRLVMNVVRPGEAEFVLRLIGQLQSDQRFGDLKYVFRLFGDPKDPSLGATLDSFMSDPEGAGLPRETADALTRPSEDPLVPKLAYSKHDIGALVDHPLDFPAHLSVFLDYFDFEVVPVPEAPDGRSLFGGGIIVEPTQRYDVGDAARPPNWVNAVSPTVGNGLFPAALQSLLSGTARAMGGVGVNPVPAVRLELDTVAQALLDAVHRVSDWVVVIDPVFSDEFLDSATDADRDPLYVLDTRAATGDPGGRTVVVSSRLRREQSGLLAGAAARFGIQLPPGSAERLSRSLQVLGAGIGLKLLMDETRATEAFSLALATEHLRSTGILRHGLVVPIDLHQDLFREGQRSGVVDSLSRTDLAVIQFDPDERRVGIHLVEVKVRSSLSEDGDIPSALVSEMTEQLENTEVVLLDRLFGLPLRRMTRSLPAALQVRRLTLFLRHYLERSSRHGWISKDEIEPISAFVESLDSSFRVGVSLHGIIFHTKGSGERVEWRGGLRLSVLGSEYLEELLDDKVKATTKIAGAGPDAYAKTVFKAPESWHDVEGESAPASLIESAEEKVEAVGMPVAESAAGAYEGEPATGRGRAEEQQYPKLEDVEILGVTEKPQQFGVIGALSSGGKEVAIDLGPNVISVFGVQGSGKSYTVGTIIEAALLPTPKLHKLDTPLGVAVFHYSDNPTYVPEYTSMMSPSPDDRTKELLGRLGLPPQGVGDLVIVVPPRTLEQRKHDFPDHRVEPLYFGTGELQLSDWKLLMGIEGGNQMYARSMALVLRGLKGDLTLAKLRDAIAHSALNTAQKGFAEQRLEFAAEYLQDGARIADLMKSGRLVVVDMRDELIDKTEALALFMVLLNRFTEVRGPKIDFNRLIVFDEAHKYMSEGNLTELITETVREMRHRGASIVVASQDPPSVPQTVIELSTVIITHKFTSPAWLRYLGKVSSAFANVRGSQLTNLGPGSAYAWTRDNPKFERPQRIDIRARLTQHGGETRLASG